MPTLRTPDDFRLNLHRAATGASRWWSRRPWADAMTIVDTAAYVPGRHNAAPLMRSTRKPRRARRDDPDMTWFHVRPALPPATTTARRALDALGAGYRSLQLPATIRLVPFARDRHRPGRSNAGDAGASDDQLNSCCIRGRLAASRRCTSTYTAS
jgi:hypothetical protein